MNPSGLPDNFGLPISEQKYNYAFFANRTGETLAYNTRPCQRERI